MSSTALSTGWNTNPALYATNYDPTALAAGLQSAATYDPTTQSTTTPTSAARLTTSLNSQNNATQSAPSAAQNTSASGSASGGTTSLLATPTTAATNGLTAASNNTVNAAYKSNLSGPAGNTPATPYTPPAQPSASTPTTGSGGTAPAFSTAAPGGSLSSAQPRATTLSGNTATLGGTALTYSGPQAVKVGGHYYVFNPSKGQYDYIGYAQAIYDKNYNVIGYQYPGNMSQDQVASAVDYTHTVKDGSGNNTALIEQEILQQPAIASGLAAYQTALQNASQTAQSNAQAATGGSQYQSTLDYMTTHNGQLSPQDQAALSQTYSGSTSGSAGAAQQAAIQKAESDYAAQQQHAAGLSSLGYGGVDTSAVDATNRAAMASLISQYSSQPNGAGGALATRLGGFNAGNLAGQNQLSHDTAAATSYDSNVSNLANALQTQYSADKAGTGNQLYADIQNVQQVAAQLQQEMGQLSASDQQSAQAQLSQLNSYISAYQQAVAQFGQGSNQAMTAAGSILSAGATLAMAVL